ncbi:hypothetical protein BD408DRAFT_137960 [Parasitella parasitica]|nr:hypothetical protein BD408DRAFT_137960 [Parasitella parasitica]
MKNPFLSRLSSVSITFFHKFDHMIRRGSLFLKGFFFSGSFAFLFLLARFAYSCSSFSASAFVKEKIENFKIRNALNDTDVSPSLFVNSYIGWFF